MYLSWQTVGGLLLVLCAPLCLAACSKEPKDPAVLPPSWPLPYLQLPADASKEMVGLGGARYMHDLKHYDQFTLDGEILESEEGKHQVWSVGFDTRMSWNKLATHIETQISPHGFINEGVSPDYARRNSEDILEKEAHFYSQALQMSVILFFKSDPAGEGYDAFEGHSLTLVQIMEKTSNDGQDNKTGEVTP